MKEKKGKKKNNKMKQETNKNSEERQHPPHIYVLTECSTPDMIGAWYTQGHEWI